MTKLYVTEYAGLMPSPVGGQGQVPMEPPLAEQVVDYTSGAAVSAALNAQTRVVRLHPDSICSVLISAAGTNAATTNQRMAASATEYKGVPVGAGYKVSAITNT